VDAPRTLYDVSDPAPLAVVIGRGQLASGADNRLRARGADVIRLREPNDRDVRAALERDPDVVLIASPDDIVALRHALLVEYVRPGIRLIVTIFDRTVAEQVRRAVRNSTVVSAADLAIPALLGPCVDATLVALTKEGDRLVGVKADGAGVKAEVVDGDVLPSPAQRAWGWVASQLRPPDTGSRLLVGGILLLVAILVVDTALAIGRGEGFVEAWYSAVKTVATVGPNHGVDEGSEDTRVVGSISILLAAVVFAAFTAGLVQRLLSPRLVGIVGRRTLPRSDHVIVVGLGHFGFRLCLALKDLGIRVVAVEQNEDKPYVALAKRLGVPVVIADGRDRWLHERLGLRQARALAAVTADDLTNISVSVAALAVRPDARVVLRAFEGAVTDESQALFHIGVVRDVWAVASAGLAAAALGQPTYVALRNHDMFLVGGPGDVTPLRGE
jgi:hypothetical protein